MPRSNVFVLILDPPQKTGSTKITFFIQVTNKAVLACVFTASASLSRLDEADKIASASLLFCSLREPGPLVDDFSCITSGTFSDRSTIVSSAPPPSTKDPEKDYLNQG
jgi:hypothetical protein